MLSAHCKYVKHKKNKRLNQLLSQIGENIHLLDDTIFRTGCHCTELFNYFPQVLRFKVGKTLKSSL